MSDSTFGELIFVGVLIVMLVASVFEIAYQDKKRGLKNWRWR